MKKSKIAIVVLSALVLTSCGMKNEEKQVPSKPAITETVIAGPKNIEVCVKDAQGNPIMNSSGICWSPGEVVILAPPKEAKTEEDLKYKSVEPSKEIEAILADLAKAKKVEATKPKVVHKKVESKKYVEQLKETKVYPEIEKTPEVVSILDRLSRLNIIMLAPSNAELGKMSKVEVIVDLSKIEDKEKIDGRTIIGAKLYAPDFSAITVSQPKQSFANYDKMRWIWELTPQKSGSKEIVVSLHTQVPDTNIEKFIGTYNKAIKVAEPPTSVFKNGWFWASSFAVLGGFWYWRRKTKKEEIL